MQRIAHGPLPQSEVGGDFSQLRLVESVLAHAHEAVFIYDVTADPAASCIVFVNAAFAALTGMEAAGLVGGLPFHLTGNQAVTSDGATSTYRYRKVDGSPIFVAVRLVGLADAEQRTTHMVAFCYDATALESTTALRLRAAASDKKNIGPA